MWKFVLSALLFLSAGCDRSPSPSALIARGPDDVAAPEAAPPPPAQDDPAAGQQAGKTEYTCPMHPEVVSDKPGTCPKCNMNLEPKPSPAPGDHGAHEHGAHEHGAHEHGAHHHSPGQSADAR